MATKDIIRLGRERLGMTPLAFGNAVGVSRGAVQQWERGVTAPTRKHQPKVAALIGVSVAELMEQSATSDPNAIDVPSRWVDEPQPERAALGMTTALPTLAQALEALASAFAHTPESTRNTVATLTASAVRDPATLPDCLRAIEALAAYSTATVETAAISKVGA